jgi:hypothetical protein
MKFTTKLSSLVPTFGALGILTNRNKGYTPGTRRTTRA